MTRTAAREIAIRLGFRIALSGEAPEQALLSFLDPDYYETLRDEDKLFSEYPGEGEVGYIRALVLGVAEKSAELDGHIEKHSKNWKVSRISKTALAILRAAVFEILYLEEVPDAAAINEAVELAKKYEDADTVAFINGVLGGFMRRGDQEGGSG